MIETHTDSHVDPQPPHEPQMLIAMQLVGGFGGEPGAWRLPGVPLDSYTNMDNHVRLAQAAERGKIQLLFFADTPALETDLTHQLISRSGTSSTPWWS